MLLTFIFDSLDLLNLPQSIKDMIEISFILPFFQEDIGFSRSFKVARTKVLVVFGVDEKNDIVVLDALFIGFHFELIMQNQTEDSFWNVFIDDFETASNGECGYTSAHLLLAFETISLLVVLIADVVGVLDFWVLDETLHEVLLESTFSEKLLVYKHPLKTVRHITLSLAMIYSKWSVDTDFVSFLFIGTIGIEHEYIFF